MDTHILLAANALFAAMVLVLGVIAAKNPRKALMKALLTLTTNLFFLLVLLLLSYEYYFHRHSCPMFMLGVFWIAFPSLPLILSVSLIFKFVLKQGRFDWILPSTTAALVLSTFFINGYYVLVSMILAVIACLSIRRAFLSWG